MTPEERAELKAHLKQRSTELSAQSESQKAASRPVAPDDAIGRLTRMDAIQSQEMTKQTRHTALPKCRSAHSTKNSNSNSTWKHGCRVRPARPRTSPKGCRRFSKSETLGSTASELVLVEEGRLCGAQRPDVGVCGRGQRGEVLTTLQGRHDPAAGVPVGEIGDQLRHPAKVVFAELQLRQGV